VSSIIITGASGWLGKCAVNLINSDERYRSTKLFLFSSSEKQIQLKGQKYEVKKFLDFNVNSFQDIKVVGIIHLSFLTRDKVSKVGFEEYVKINKLITSKFAEIVSSTKPNWITTVSSGAAKENTEDIEINPYGNLKIQEEQTLSKLAKDLGLNYSIGRLWGAMGYDMPINRNYAISDFICQALISKKINVNAKKLVTRRYVSDMEFIETCINSAEKGVNRTFDSGGDKIEVRDLARLVASHFGEIDVHTEPAVEPSDNYFPNNEEYLDLREELKLSKPETLKTLVLNTIEGHKSQQLR
jgi:nucleoside-diphosphate-sugar epimerase